MTLPLEDIRVLDLTVWQQGPMTSALLADMGADVIKVEGPDSPDPGRGLTGQAFYPREGPNPYFETHNRNKRGIVLDLKTQRGKEILYRLVEQADVVVQNFRVGVAERLGLDYATLSAINPGLIHAPASGFGPKGSDRELPSLDILAQARGGIMSVTGDLEAPPGRTVNGLVDQVSAFLLAYGIMVALFHRQRTGQGQEVDSSLLGAAIASQGWNLTSFLMTGSYAGLPIPRVSRKLTTPLWNQYRGGDGVWFVLGMPQIGRYWPRLRQAVREATGEELEPEHMDFDYLRTHASEMMAIIARLDELFAQKPAAEWRDLFRRHGLLVELVQGYPEVSKDPQALANDMIVTFDHPTHGPVPMVGVAVNLRETAGSIRRPAPEFGQHTEEVLLECGLSWEEIEELRQQGAIGPRPLEASEG